MPSTYTLNNGIELIATGEQSGTWGDTTNTNMSLLDTALDGQVTVTLASAGTSGSPNTLPISDGAASDGRNRLVIFNDGADLGATAYVQLTPNDAEKIVYIRNALSGSRSIIVFQGTYNASNDYEIPAGTTAVVYFNGGGTGAVAANVFNNAYFDSLRLGSVSVTAILDEDDMSSDSPTSLATQQSIKAYVDSQVGTVDTLAEILANGNTTGGTDISVSSSDDITFSDSSKAIFGAGSDLLIYHDGSNSYISETGTGSLRIRSNQIRLEAPDSQNMVIVTEDAGVQAFYNGTERFTVTNTGIDVTGTAVTDGVTVDGSLTFQDDASFPTTGLVLNANTYLYQRGGSGGIIFSDASGTNEISRFTGASAIFNEDGRDTDFRVESDAATHMLFVDGGNNRVGIGEAAPGNPLHVTTSLSGDILTLESTNAGVGVGPSINLYRNSSSPAANDLGPALYFRGENSVGGQHTYANIYSQYTNVADGTEACNLISQISVLGVSRSVLSLLASSASVVINDESQDIDFRVESDSNANQLFVDAGNSLTYVGSNTTTTIPSANGFGVKAGGEKTVVLESTAADTLLLFRDSGTTTPPYIGSFGDDLAISGYGGGTPNVGIGITAPQSAFHINQNGGPQASGDMTTGLIVSNGTAGTAIQMGTNDAGGYGYIKSAYVNSAQTARALLLYAGTDKAISVESNTVIMNDDSLDRDFRVESDNNTHMLFVDAGNNKAGFNSSSLTNTGLVQMHGTYAATNTADYRDNNVLTLTGNDPGTTADDSGINLAFVPVVGRGSAGVIAVETTGTNKEGGGQMRFFTGGGSYPTTLDEKMQLNHNNGVIFNETGGNIDFRVESDSNTHAFFVDAGAGEVNVGTPTGPDAFNVLGKFDNAGFYRNYSGVGTAATYVKIGRQDTNGDLVDGVRIVGGGDDNVEASHNGYFNIEIRNSGTYRSLISALSSGNEFVVNNDSHDMDFRVESDANTHAFFLDAGTGNIGMGGVSNVPLNIFRNGAGNTELLRLTNNNTNNHNFYVYVNDDDNYVRFGSTGDNGGNFAILDSTNTNDTIRLFTGGGAVFNEQSGSAATTTDFRVESDSNASMLFVDASLNQVMVGIGSAPINRSFYVESQTYPCQLRMGTSAVNYPVLQLRSGYVTGGQTGTQVDFRDGSDSSVGTITSTVSGTAYNTTSDARLKENISDAEDSGATVDAIQVRKFDWKVDGSHQRYGMVAQELVEVAPEAVTGKPDGEEMMGVDYSKLVPMLIKEIQSLRARVAQLESN